ncbi:hypothetical protein HDV06_000388 [Boothiomyces sp. JEL0866]|nr:hypothetical protein HDV06_000388 [Boothiomyces sp. JEL0866]
MIIVTGASGLLGRAVFQELQKNHSVIGTAFSRTKGSLLKLDLTNSNKVEEFISLHKPNIVVHCAAERKPDVCANDEQGTLKLNVESSKQLAKLSVQYSFKLIYISTDYVFDGKNPPYEAEDQPNPLNFYGKSKYLGELAILENAPSSIVLRVPILYGNTLFNAESAVNILIDVITNPKPVEMDHYQSRFPTNVADVALAIDKIIALLQTKETKGIYHFSAKQRMTKYQMCQVFSEILKTNIGHLKPNAEPPKDPVATRPVDVQLSTKKLESLGVIYSLLLPNGWTREVSSTPQKDTSLQICSFRELYVQKDFGLVLVYHDKENNVAGLVIGILGMLQIVAPKLTSNDAYCDYFLREYLKPFTNLDIYDSSKSVNENIDEQVSKFIENAIKLNETCIGNVLDIRDSLIDFYHVALVDVYVGSTGSKIWKAFQPFLDKPIEDVWNYYVDDSEYLMENGILLLNEGLLPKTRCKPTEIKPIEPRYDLHAQNAKLYEMIETEKNFVQCLEFLDFAYNEFLVNWKKAGLASQSIIKFTVIPVSNLLAAHKSYLKDLESATTPLVLCQIFQKHIKLIIPPTKDYTLAHDQLRYIKQDQLKNSKSEKNTSLMNTFEFRTFVARIEQSWESKTGKSKYLGDELQKPTGRIIGYQNLFEALYKYSGNEKIFKDAYEISVRSAKALNHSLISNHMENMMQQIHIKTLANFQFTYDGERITFLTDFSANQLILHKDRFVSQPIKLLVFSKFVLVLKKGKNDYVNAGHYLLKDLHVYKTAEGFALIHDERCIQVELDFRKASEFLGLIKHLKFKDLFLKKKPAYVESNDSTIYYRLVHDQSLLENSDATLILLEEEVDYTNLLESNQSNVLLVAAVNADGRLKLVKRIRRQPPVETITHNIPEEYEWKSFTDFNTDLVGCLKNSVFVKHTSPKFTLPRDKEVVKRIIKHSLNDLVVKSQLPDSHPRIKSTQSYKSLAPSTNSIQQLFHKFSIKRRNTSIATGGSKLTPSISTSISFRKEGRVGILNNIKTIFKKEISSFDALLSITNILQALIATRVKVKQALPPLNQLIDETRVSQFINSIIKDKKYMMDNVAHLISDQEIIVVLKEYLLKQFTRKQLDLYETFFSQINELMLANYDLGDLGLYLVAVDECDKEHALIVFDNLLFHCHSMFKMPNEDDTKSVFSFIGKEEEEQGRIVEYELVITYQSVHIHTHKAIEFDYYLQDIKFEFNEKRQQLQIQEEDTLVELVKMTTSSSLDMEFIDSMKAKQDKPVEEMLRHFTTPIDVTADFFNKTISSINE